MKFHHKCWNIASSIVTFTLQMRLLSLHYVNCWWNWLLIHPIRMVDLVCTTKFDLFVDKVWPFFYTKFDLSVTTKFNLFCAFFTTKFDLFVTTKFDFSVTTKFDLFVTTKFDLFVTTKFDLYVTTKFDLIFFELKNEKASRKQLDFVSFLPIIFFNRKCNLLKKLLFWSTVKAA